MQAHPQSIPAARTFLPPSQVSQLAPRPASPLLDIGTRHPLPAPPEPTFISAGIAQTSGLAHDAGNLLGALTLYCDLLRAPGVLRQEHRHYATELSLISTRSSELIQRLLAAPSSRPQPPSHDALEFQPSAVRRRDSLSSETLRPDLAHAAVLRNLAPVLDRIAAGAARVWVSVPAALPALHLPVEALERITVNLVRNAAEAIRNQHVDPNSASAPAPGEVRVAFGPVAGRLQLTVEDNGPGIPPAVAAAFLRPTELPPNTRRGLGHRIVHELVSASGGQLSIRVRPGRGTAFCIKWPLPQPPGDTACLTTPPKPRFAEQPTVPMLDARKGAATC